MIRRAPRATLEKGGAENVLDKNDNLRWPVTSVATRRDCQGAFGSWLCYVDTISTVFPRAV